MDFVLFIFPFIIFPIIYTFSVPANPVIRFFEPTFFVYQLFHPKRRLYPQITCDIYIYIYIYGVGGVWVQFLGVRGHALVLFLLYVNVSGMRTRSRLSSQPFTIAAPWVLLQVRWLIPLVPWFHPG